MQKDPFKDISLAYFPPLPPDIAGSSVDMSFACKQTKQSVIKNTKLFFSNTVTMQQAIEPRGRQPGRGGCRSCSEGSKTVKYQAQ